ncbi:hypothetical protein [uncultured Mediterranean phage uvMED]|nr:hypothetical protein [uncultured Mediterranean phage uvMED]
MPNINDRIKVESFTLTIAGEHNMDNFTEIINAVEEISKEGGYFKLIDYTNPEDFTLEPKEI